ncbi:hypothetical protein FB45DRAFT_1011237 [Roridomyces roridus]|uniref:Uncharacterized protein n=1 Tax=Roridomyces roridus TaxID=1738132 RepID=A0AAD7B2S9_9AGAR|nr:hypothetical protein FB45DRAFT_1011237 [Roridomyces roridus]
MRWSRYSQRKVLDTLERGFVDVGVALHEVLADDCAVTPLSQEPVLLSQAHQYFTVPNVIRHLGDTVLSKMTVKTAPVTNIRAILGIRPIENLSGRRTPWGLLGTTTVSASGESLRLARQRQFPPMIRQGRAESGGAQSRARSPDGRITFTQVGLFPSIDSGNHAVDGTRSCFGLENGDDGRVDGGKTGYDFIGSANVVKTMLESDNGLQKNIRGLSEVVHQRVELAHEHGAGGGIRDGVEGCKLLPKEAAAIADAGVVNLGLDGGIARELQETLHDAVGYRDLRINRFPTTFGEE